MLNSQTPQCIALNETADYSQLFSCNNLSSSSKTCFSILRFDSLKDTIPATRKTGEAIMNTHPMAKKEGISTIFTKARPPPKKATAVLMNARRVRLFARRVLSNASLSRRISLLYDGWFSTLLMPGLSQTLPEQSRLSEPIP